MLSFLGKLLIVVSLVFQAYILFENQTVAKEFNAKLLAALETCKCIPDHIAGHILEHGRLVVAVLLASSALMILSRCWFFKLWPLVGLSVLLYIEHQPFTKIPCIGCSRLWEKVAIIGAIIYLMGVDCAAKCSTNASKAPVSASASKVDLKAAKSDGKTHKA
jgi:hypothetical protein